MIGSFKEEKVVYKYIYFGIFIAKDMKVLLKDVLSTLIEKALIPRKEKITGWEREFWHQMGWILKTVFELLNFFMY